VHAEAEIRQNNWGQDDKSPNPCSEKPFQYVQFKVLVGASYYPVPNYSVFFILLNSRRNPLGDNQREEKCFQRIQGNNEWGREKNANWYWLSLT
jgi:hypothetical protein